VTTERRILIIGGGVVGLACAWRLAAERDANVFLAERHLHVGTETSSRNSEVIHAGIYYPADSLKARLCIEGRRLLLAFCAEHGVPHRLCGKLIVATDEDELTSLEQVGAKAAACGPDEPLQRWGPDRIREHAPGVRAVAALWSPGTGIIDSHALMHRLRVVAERRGALVLVGHEVVGVDRAQGVWRVRLRNPAGDTEAHDFEQVINAAGHEASRVAGLAGHDAPRSIRVKGNYFALAGPAPADCLVYPVPRPNLVGLGTHLTLDLAGRGRLGPDVQLDADPADFAVDPGRRDAFYKAARRFLPALQPADLSPDYSGFRPKLATDRFADFHIAGPADHGTDGWVDLCGIESPGLTAALAIAERAAAALG